MNQEGNERIYKSLKELQDIQSIMENPLNPFLMEKENEIRIKIEKKMMEQEIY